jgi:uncharacterized membrane protein (DUF4010 family)
LDGTWQQLAISVALGLLVGLQREWSDHPAGIRTFTLITVLGSLTALLGDDQGPWLLAAGLLAVAGAMVAMMRLRGAQASDGQPELTSVIAALVMYLVGAAVVSGQTGLAVAIAGTTAVLLHWKKPLHGFVDRIGEPAIRAVFRLVLIALVILPLLPDQTYGPYDVLNPHRVWLMVVLIVGISVGSYLTHHLVGRRAGLVAGGVLGGLISSTATTVSSARQSKLAPETSTTAAAVIVIASTLAFVRVAVEVAIVAPRLGAAVLPQFAVVAGMMAVMSAIAYVRARSSDAGPPAVQDPTDLKAALVFGALYAVVLLGVAAAEAHLGNVGMYVIATLSGLTDVDAITLSTAELMKTERIAVDTGWRMMMIAALSNVAFKWAAVALLGPRRLLAPVGLMFLAAIVSGCAVLWLWPPVG